MAIQTTASVTYGHYAHGMTLHDDYRTVVAPEFLSKQELSQAYDYIYDSIAPGLSDLVDDESLTQDSEHPLAYGNYIGRHYALFVPQ